MADSRGRRFGPPWCSITTRISASVSAPRRIFKSQSSCLGFQPTAHPHAPSFWVSLSRKEYFSSAIFPEQDHLTKRRNGCSRCHQRLARWTEERLDKKFRQGVSPPLRRPQSRAKGSRKCSHA